MTTKKPDLDSRGHPVTIAAGYNDNLAKGGMVSTQLYITIHEEIHRQFVETTREYEVSPRALLTQLYYEACSEMGIDTETYNLGACSSYWKKKHATIKLHISDVIMDECDLPGQCNNVELGELDPYYSSFLVRDTPRDKRSIYLRKLERHINEAAKAIERLTSMKSYTSVFNEGRISKEEAKRELELVLNMMPEELGSALWGWCSLNDAIHLIKRWKSSVILRMKEQLEIETMRISAESRARFEAKVNARLNRQKQRMIGTYRRQKELRPKPKPGEWPSWAGQMESYLDHASSSAMTTTQTPYFKRRIRARDIVVTDTGSITEVQSDCTVDISKGLTNDSTN